MLTTQNYTKREMAVDISGTIEKESEMNTPTVMKCAKGHMEKIVDKMVYEDTDGTIWYIKTAYKHMGKFYVTCCAILPEEGKLEWVDE